jgi:hypothetical protein
MMASLPTRSRSLTRREQAVLRGDGDGSGARIAPNLFSNSKSKIESTTKEPKS